MKSIVRSPELTAFPELTPFPVPVPLEEGGTQGHAGP